MEQIAKTLTSLGFNILHIGKKNANGPDIWAIKDQRPYSFEVKKVKLQRERCAQVPPVEPNRRKDDFIAIAFPSGYVLVEPMKDHLNNCSSKGYRSITGLC